MDPGRVDLNLDPGRVDLDLDPGRVDLDLDLTLEEKPDTTLEKQPISEFDL